jgi:hypothetical protein
MLPQVPEWTGGNPLATATDICRILSDRLSIPLSDVRQRANRIREAGYLPQGGRGRHAPRVDAKHVAALLISVMGSVEYPAVRAVQALRRIGDLRRGPILMNLGDGNQGEFLPSGSFLDALTWTLLFGQTPLTAATNTCINEIGVMFGQESVLAWLSISSSIVSPSTEDIIPDPFAFMVASRLRQKSGPDLLPCPLILTLFGAESSLDLLVRTRKEFRLKVSDVFPALTKALGLIGHTGGNPAARSTETESAGGSHRESIAGQASHANDQPRLPCVRS